jgi:hypothetical protein
MDLFTTEPESQNRICRFDLTSLASLDLSACVLGGAIVRLSSFVEGPTLSLATEATNARLQIIRP